MPSGKTFKIQFNNINGPGKLVPDFKNASGIVFNGSEYAVTPGSIKDHEVLKNEFEEKLESKINDIDAILGSLDLDVIFDDETLYKEHIVDGKVKLNKISDKWEKLFKRHDENNEKTPELSIELDDCRKELDNFLEEIEKNKLEKKANDDFLSEPRNKGWEDQFRKASVRITEEFVDMLDFNVKNPGITIGDVDKDFDFDLREYLLESADLPNAKKDPFGLVGKKKWIEIFAAARMVNDSRTPKKFIIVGDQTYAMPDAKKSKTFDKDDVKKARESLNRVVIEKLQKKFEEKEVYDISGNLLWGKNVKNADLRYLAFEILKDVLEDKNNLGIVLDEGVDSLLLDDEKKKMDIAVDEIFKENNSKEANRLAVRVYVYNKIGSAIAQSDKSKNLTNEEKYIKNRELVDDVLQSFDQDLQAKISSFIDQREQAGSKGIILAKEQRKAMESAIIKYVDENLLVVKPAGTADPNIAVVAPSSHALGVLSLVSDVDALPIEKPKEKTPEDLFKELNVELSVFSVERYQMLYNEMMNVVGKKGIVGDEKKKLVLSVLPDVIERDIARHTKKRGEELEKISEYILSQIK
ncbi:MAG: hypothetical protein US57_C0008G0032 [Candidatus Moranbacteria bacterium GW2011_GWC2_37_73]|nr:MAG: hypothetical protein UR95_C0001G0080 [Parcubacteria group bacterium GW2011_GWC1_36_108]KKQ00106.1 MAG: hypothetical protein US09_C0021G0026 [Candidatus Moranbacteria bacterium GW2011_GWD1_36_198]KKQ00412.1 MAG: hypothetical protein US10_C0032G0009 [Candidatus Moranbacteria bacterium GW2011_GWD2_36_198]KKQ39848.1 MAG: hypothetical protein US57_C0008G0032 [Candidatus Moranbacteria bacterium GW2011_GWC2_37_73]HAS00013.1 hypothetical protein [Candidatus Moranbacteria bacterium]